MSSLVFEYSKLFLQFCKRCKLSNDLDDFKVAPYICPNHTDIGIHSGHGYLDTLEQPSRTTLNTYATRVSQIGANNAMRGVVHPGYNITHISWVIQMACYIIHVKVI